MGNGDYYTPPLQEGASWIWVAQPDVASEAIAGLGMLAGTNHSHMNAVFQFDPGHEDPPPPDEQLLDVVLRIDAQVRQIAQEIKTVRPRRSDDDDRTASALAYTFAVVAILTYLVIVLLAGACTVQVAAVVTADARRCNLATCFGSLPCP